MATTTVRILFARRVFQVLPAEVVLSAGSFTVTEVEDGCGLGQVAVVLEACMPADADLELTVRSANKTFTGPHGQFVYPELGRANYSPASPEAANGLTKVSGSLLAQSVVAPHTIHVVTYAPVCG
eukprot:EG_transcript_31430